MVHREIARQVATADSESASQFYVTLTSVYVPYTCRSESQISPTVAYARTASMMYGMGFADEAPPIRLAPRSLGAAPLFSISPSPAQGKGGLAARRGSGCQRRRGWVTGR